MTKKTQKPKSITGRDGYILCKALAYAILCIERLPPRWQEFSDKEDMKVMLEYFANLHLGTEHFMLTAQAHITKKVMAFNKNVGKFELVDPPAESNVVEFPGGK